MHLGLCKPWRSRQRQEMGQWPSVLGRAGLAVILALLTGHGANAQAVRLPAAGAAAVQRALIVRDDRGGLVQRRAEEIEALARERRPVEIRGEVCLSSCTMYLALPDTCVSPRTTFGFHGPSHYGAPLSPADFEYWSRIIAAHYPPPLADWYLTKARYSIASPYRVRGADLIRALGLRACVDS